MKSIREFQQTIKRRRIWVIAISACTLVLLLLLLPEWLGFSGLWYPLPHILTQIFENLFWATTTGTLMMWFEHSISQGASMYDNYREIILNTKLLEEISINPEDLMDEAIPSITYGLELEDIYTFFDESDERWLTEYYRDDLISFAASMENDLYNKWLSREILHSLDKGSVQLGEKEWIEIILNDIRYNHKYIPMPWLECTDNPYKREIPSNSEKLIDFLRRFFIHHVKQIPFANIKYLKEGIPERLKEWCDSVDRNLTFFLPQDYVFKKNLICNIIQEFERYTGEGYFEEGKWLLYDLEERFGHEYDFSKSNFLYRPVINEVELIGDDEKCGKSTLVSYRKGAADDLSGVMDEDESIPPANFTNGEVIYKWFAMVFNASLIAEDYNASFNKDINEIRNIVLKSR